MKMNYRTNYQVYSNKIRMKNLVFRLKILLLIKNPHKKMRHQGLKMMKFVHQILHKMTIQKFK